MGSPTRKDVEKYREVSEKLMDPSLISELRKLFEGRYTLVELLEWLHNKIEWSKGEMTRHSDPMEMITYEKGRCGEFGILFTALCLAHNYRARWILGVTDHVWTEVWNNKQKRWIHVGPSERRIDDPRDVRKGLEERPERNICL